MTLRKKMQEIIGYGKTEASILFMAALLLAVPILSMSLRNTEAQRLSDICEDFRILCEEESSPTEEPATTAGGTADFRAIFLTYVNTDAQRNLYNKELDSGDLVVMHLGLNQAPPTSAIDDLDDITSVPDTHKGLEFFSLPEIKKYAPLVAQRGLGFISYDLEGISPNSEEANPAGSSEDSKTICKCSRYRSDGCTFAKNCKFTCEQR